MNDIEIRKDESTTSGADYRIFRVGKLKRTKDGGEQAVQEVGWIEVHRPTKDHIMVKRMFIMIYERTNISDFTVMGTVERVFGPRYAKDSETNYAVYFIRSVKLRGV